MKNLGTSITLDLKGNLTTISKRFSAGLSDLSKAGVSGFSSLAKGAQWSSDKIGGLANRYTGAISAIAGVSAVRSIGNLEERLERLGIVADKSKEEMKAINEQIYQISQMKDVNIAPDQLTSAIEKMAAMTGDIDFATANMKNLAMAISATGAAGEDIGAMVGNMFQKFNIKDAEGILSVLDIFANQANEGSFELKDLATQGERIMAAYATLGRTGKDGLREMGALMQVSRMGTGSAEQAATAFEAMTRTFTDPAKIKLLERSGIAVKDQFGEMRAIPDIIKEIMIKTKGDAEELKKVFDTFAFRSTSAMAIEIKNAIKEGKSLEEYFKTFDKFSNVKDSGETITKDSQRMADTFNASITSLNTALMKFSQNNLTKPIEKLTEFINSLDTEKVQEYFNIAKKGVIALGAVWAGGKLLGLGGKAISFFGKGKLGALGSAAGNMSGATPVYVVNMGAGGLAGGLGNMAGVGKIAGAGLLGKGLIIAGIGAAAYYVGDTIGQGIAGVVVGEYEDAGEKFGTIVGGALGLVAGPMGVIIGSQLGKTAGGFLGRWFQNTQKEVEMADKARAERIRKFNHEKQQTVILKNENSFKIISDEKGVRVIDSTPQNQTKIPLKLDTGYTAYVR